MYSDRDRQTDRQTEDQQVWKQPSTHGVDKFAYTEQYFMQKYICIYIYIYIYMYIIAANCRQFFSIFTGVLRECVIRLLIPVLKPTWQPNLQNPEANKRYAKMIRNYKIKTFGTSTMYMFMCFQTQQLEHNGERVFVYILILGFLVIVNDM